MEPWTKEEEAAAVMARQQRVREARNESNQRNSLIAFVLGFVMIVGTIVYGVMTESGDAGHTMLIVAGILLVILGIYFRGKRY